MKIPAPAKHLLASLLLAVLVLGGVVLFFEEKLIYFPLSGMDVTPGRLGMRFEELTLAAEDGVRIHGWFFPLDPSPYTVLICHGNAGNISHRLDRVLLMQAKLQTSVLLFDYRGYGRSEGSPNERGTYRDGRAAYRYLVETRRIPASNIVVFGESLGGAVAVQLAVELPARALVLESAFTSIADVARAHFPFLPVGRLLRTRYDNLTKMASVTVPVLVLHGRRDETVPFDQGRRLFEAAPGPKAFFEIEGAGHNDTYVTGGEAYWEAWEQFLDSL